MGYAVAFLAVPVAMLGAALGSTAVFMIGVLMIPASFTIAILEHKTGGLFEMNDRTFFRFFWAVATVQALILAGLAYVVYAVLTHFKII